MEQLWCVGLRQQANAAAWERGKQHAALNTVTSRWRDSRRAIAEVRGSAGTVYEVMLMLHGAEVVSAECSCPARPHSWCKHITAVAIAWEIRDEDFTDELGALDTPGIKRFITAIRLTHGLRPSQEYWLVEGTMNQIRLVLRESERRLSRGSFDEAIFIAEMITRKYLRAVEILDDSGGFVNAFSPELDTHWAAILGTPVEAATRALIQKKLKRWRTAVEPFGYDDAFLHALEAVQ